MTSIKNSDRGSAAVDERGKFCKRAVAGLGGFIPGFLQAQYPDRDVLNGGALTPAGRMGLELPGGAASVFGTGNIGAASAYARLSGAIPGHHGRRHGRE